MTGEKLGHYQILEKIGAGGMGVVYRAHDERLERDVALKVLPRGTLADESARKRFRKEALSLSRLNHPNIATIHDFDTQDGVDFLVMELIPGETLSDALKSGPLAEKQMLRLALQIAQGLSAAHEKGVTHRDLKPGNLRVTPDGRLKILDFGLATLRRPEGEDAGTASMTERATLAGTLPYMPPEQLRGESFDERSDIYSAGAVLYEMATGRRAFPLPPGPELIGAILQKAPHPPATLNKEVSPALENVILKALDKEPARRYQSARELAVDLDRLATPTVSAVTASHPAVTRQRWLVLVAGVLAVLLALVVGFNVGGLRDRLLGHGRSRIGSLAVLPLKSLQQNTGDDYLGLGIADAIITRISQIEGVTVRPTSAVRKYASQEIESLKAAGELQADAVLDGSVQRSGDRLRVNVNLLRAVDGVSLWSESFNTSFGDIFAVQDEVSQQVASRLRLRLSPAQQARLTKRHTSNPEAYEYYLKGLSHFGAGLSPGANTEVEIGVKMLRAATEIDPNYALAYAHLAWGYTYLAVFSEPGRLWFERGQQALTRAKALDPDLPESHVVRQMMLYSSHEGYQIAPAIRELKIAQRLNPSLGHWELGDLYGHLGLDEPAIREVQRALEIDPTSEMYKIAIANLYGINGKYEESIAASQKLLNRPANALAYLGARRLEEARRLIGEALAKDPNNPYMRLNRALLLALEGKPAEGEAQILPIPDSFRTQRSFHHETYKLACLYALAGKPGPAVEWLRTTVKEGMPIYPMFTRDPNLDRIRKDPGFIQFLAELKPVWEGYQREFQ